MGLGSKVVEWIVDFRSGPSIFVEVKGPDWEAELSPEEQRGDRKKLGKHTHLEARWIAPFEVITNVISDNAAPKLLPNKPNLVITADDLFVSIVGMPHLEDRFEQFFTQNGCRNIGGSLFLRLDGSLDPDYILIRFEENPFCSDGNKLPQDVAELLTVQAAVDDGRRASWVGTSTLFSRY